MELENRGFTSPKSAGQKRRRGPAYDEEDDLSSISTSSSNDRVGKKRRSKLSSAAARRKRRRRKEGDNAVAVYNLPPSVKCKNFSAKIKTWISEIRGVEVEVVECRRMGPKNKNCPALVSFRNSDEARLALSMNGISYMKRTLYVRMYDTEENKDHKKGSKKKKQELCIKNILGNCPFGKDCHGAHGHTDLRLYNDTVLEQNRCVYINELLVTVQSQELVTAVVDRYKENNIDAYVTFFQHRKSKGDAVFEFANPSHARMALGVLRGLWSIGVHDWKPEYQAVFVAHFDGAESEDIQIEHIKCVSDEGNHSPFGSLYDADSIPSCGQEEVVSETIQTQNQSASSSANEGNRSPFEGGNDADSIPSCGQEEEVSETIQTQNQSASSSANEVQQNQTVEELERTIVSLRDKVQQLENTNHELQKQVSTDSSMEQKLREVMSRNEKLEKSLKDATEKIDQGDITNYHLRKEKEAMADELAKLRVARNHDPGTTGKRSRSRWGGKMKI